MMKAFLVILVLVGAAECNILNRFRKEGGPNIQYPFGSANSISGEWKGKWFPHQPDDRSGKQMDYKVTSMEQLKDEKHNVKMGIPFKGCDNGMANLDIDWDYSPVNHTCYTPNQPLPMDSNDPPVLECDDVPANYWPEHHCMKEAIHYDNPIPTHEGHRPLWPKFGEYVFVPPQRWLHNIEHGSVVMLYHPCAPTVYVDAVKTIVKNCIWKHIITPYNLVPEETPIVLVAWGCRFKISNVNKQVLLDVIKFIREHGHKGPEGTYMKQGQYRVGLLHLSEPVPGSQEGKLICPRYP